MWSYLGAAIKGFVFLLGLVGLITLPEDVQKWAELMGPLAEYIALSRAEFALFALIAVFGFWILFPAATPFVKEVRQFFLYRQARSNIPSWLTEHVGHQISNIQGLIRVDIRLGDVNPNLDKIDPYIGFIIVVENNSIFDIIIESFSGSISYEGDRLSTTPSLAKENQIIEHNKRRSVHLFLPVSESFKSKIIDMPAEELRNKITVDAVIEYFFTDLSGQKLGKELSVPPKYFVKEG